VVAVGVFVLLVLVQQQPFLDLPGMGRVAGAVPDALHGAWFACLTWMLLLIVDRRAHGARAVVITAVIGVSVAVGTELLQKSTGGDAESGDVFFDMVGMTAALLLWGAHRGFLAPRPGVSLAVLLLTGSLWPVVPALLTESYRKAIEPELVRFDSAQGRGLYASNSSIAIVPAPGDWSIAGPALRIELADETWPGVRLDRPLADWSPYSTLEVDLFVDDSGPMPVTISVRLDNAPVVQVFERFTCAPGPCHLELPFAALFDRAVARINMVVIFSEREHAGRVMYLGRVALRT
jgi:hypothetical protein